MASAENPEAEAVPGHDAAHITMRSAGYCVLCDSIVERGSGGACPDGHSADAVSGNLWLEPSEAVPHLKRFNLAAFLIPPVWGPAHGQWVGAAFLPIWLFTDNVIRSAVAGGNVQRTAAAAVVTSTLVFQFAFAKRANGLAYRRVIDRLSVAEFEDKQRVWTLAAVPAWVALLTFAVWFELIFRG